MTRSVSESIETESTYCVPISDSSRLILSLPGAVRAGRRTTGRLVRKTRPPKRTPATSEQATTAGRIMVNLLFLYILQISFASCYLCRNRSGITCS